VRGHQDWPDKSPSVYQNQVKLTYYGVTDRGRHRMTSNAALLRLKSLAGDLVGIVTWQGFFCRWLNVGKLQKHSGLAGGLLGLKYEAFSDHDRARQGKRPCSYQAGWIYPHSVPKQSLRASAPPLLERHRFDVVSSARGDHGA
jgi:hypothetical protein